MANRLTINFGLASPDPGSYRVKYWPASNPANITTITVTSSPAVVDGLEECFYNGSVEAICGQNSYSTPQLFFGRCPYQVLTYTPCALVSEGGNITPSDVYLADGVTDVATGVQLYDKYGNAFEFVLP